VADAIRAMGARRSLRDELLDGEIFYTLQEVHAPGGQGRHRELEAARQYDPPPCLAGRQTSRSGGACARLCGLAGCALPTGCAGQAPRSAQTSHALIFTPDHPRGAVIMPKCLSLLASPAAGNSTRLLQPEILSYIEWGIVASLKLN
jgi:hypothetical protein